MAKRLIPFSAVLFAIFATTSALAFQDFEQQIAGIWRGNSAKTREYLKLPSLASDSDEDYLKQVATLSVEFGKDRSVAAREGDNSPMKGTWELVKDEDGKIEIDLIRDDDTTRATFLFLDPNSVAISITNERPIVFAREGQSKIEDIAAKLVGTWEFDKTATEGLETNKDFSQGQINGMMQELDGMNVSFTKDGSFEISSSAGGDLDELKGKWKSTSLQDSRKSFELSLEADRGPDSLTGEFRNDGSVRFSPPDQPGAIFKRINKK